MQVSKLPEYFSKLIKNPYIVVPYFGSKGLLNWMSDEPYLKLCFRALMGYKLDLKNPKTYNEKLQWIKLYDRKSEYTIMVDKYAVREHIKKTIGEKYLVPLIGVWSNPDEIDFNALPNQFVLKCNHNSGLGMCICRNKEILDVTKVKTELHKGLKQDYYLIAGREWPYKNVPRKIICEKYLDEKNGSAITDYKVMCFNGVPKLVEVHKDRFTERHTQNFYDVNWNKTIFHQLDLPLSQIEINKPACLDEMLRLSSILASGIPHVRVDWYFIDNNLYFGELTFFDSSGYSAFKDGQDEIIGSWINLPE